MDLDEYIERTIVSVCKGIERAKSKVGHGAIAPKSIIDSEGIKKTSHQIRTFDFEVIVSVSKENKLEVVGDLGINCGVKAFFKGKKGNLLANQNVNKVCFSIPYLPEAIPQKSLQEQEVTDNKSK